VINVIRSAPLLLYSTSCIVVLHNELDNEYPHILLFYRVVLVLVYHIYLDVQIPKCRISVYVLDQNHSTKVITISRGAVLVESL
jgi:hypothetical protein